MKNNNDKPLIVQSDGSILLEVMADNYETVRDAILPFAELIKSPEYVHTYRLTPLSIWNAAATGLTYDAVLERLERYSRYALPPGVLFKLQESFDRWDAIRLFRHDAENLRVEIENSALMNEITKKPRIQQHIVDVYDSKSFLIPADMRGRFKHILIKQGYPVNDLVGYEPGDPLEIRLRPETLTGREFALRPYQREAVEHFWRGGSVGGGQGVVVLSCGAGKTVVALGAMAEAGTYTLILCTNVAAVHQWRNELLDKTDLTEDMIGEYSGARKEIRPVTITTYQILTYRKNKNGPFEHMKLMQALNWGLMIYDEVHVLPAPVFRATTEIQAKRRLGLTATLIREDGLEDDTFSLVGPKCYDVPWKELEAKGFIAEAQCHEVRVPLPPDLEAEYLAASDRQQYRIASENHLKDEAAMQLLHKHPDEPALVIGQYISQLKRIAKRLNAPVITGSTPNSRRDALYQAFRQGEVPVLVVSKVANFAIDLPDASVAIQVSGTFGSRQEEAQRLGRILRPKERVSTFYSLVTERSSEEDFAHKRQVFLAEQGYKYMIEEWSLDDFNQ